MSHTRFVSRRTRPVAEYLEPRRLLSDSFEPNNSFAAATNFGTLGDREEFNLDIDPSGDQDFYKFTALGSGNIFIRISFVSFFGDLDLFLYGPSNNLLAFSDGTSNTEEINFDIVEGQNYTIDVAGFQGDTNIYDMLIDGPDSGSNIVADRFEPNDSFGAATNLGTLGDRTENDLNIHLPSNDDYFRFTAADSGSAIIAITFTHSLGDLDMVLYDNNQQFLNSSEGEANTETITQMLTAGQTYYFKVFGFNGAVNPDYDLSIDGPGSAAPAPTVTTSSFSFETAQAIQFNFDQDVSASIDLTDLTVMNLTTSQTLPSSAFTVGTTSGGGTSTATWTAVAPLEDGNYLATLNGAGVTNGSGTPIASNPTRDFFALAGDADRDRDVDVNDLGTLATHWQQTGHTFSGGNFDYSPDGLVGVGDLGLLATNWQKTLAQPSAPFAATARRSPIRLVDQIESL